MDAPERPDALDGNTGFSDTKDAGNGSFSQASQNSQTASDFIDSQLQLEADAREALPYAFDHCTQPLGPLRQNLFSCLTCNPPPEAPTDPYTPAAVCYSCSIACHGEHTLVELFNRRNFTCDCGTTRLPETSPCTLRIDPATGMKGPVHSQASAEGNTYNHNCRNRFCGCGEVYNAEEEKGTMFQCLGLAGESEGGCGEDWWHPECVVGLGREWGKEARNQANERVRKAASENEEAEAEYPFPPGFPHEDRFDAFICYKCVDANPWIKRYAGSIAFLPPVYRSVSENTEQVSPLMEEDAQSRHSEYRAAQAKAIEDSIAEYETRSAAEASTDEAIHVDNSISSKKRKVDDAELNTSNASSSKKPKAIAPQYHNYLPEGPTKTFSLFCKEDFREYFCRCAECYPLLKKHPQLMEEEELYEPPVSESGDEAGGQSVGTGSLLDRGEAALNNVDRVKAIEGVMVYNHLKDKVKSFLQPFAESGQPVGAEDIKAYFEKLRGDEQGIKEAAISGAGNSGDGSGDNRREQSGY